MFATATAAATAGPTIPLGLHRNPPPPGAHHSQVMLAISMISVSLCLKHDLRYARTGPLPGSNGQQRAA